MDMVSLQVTARIKDAKARALRVDGQVPCVLYGNDVTNTSLQCDHNVLYRAFVKAGHSTLVDLQTGEKKVPVLFHKIDFDPVTEKIIHVDFYAVDMKREIEANIPLKFIGESLAVKDEGGVMVTALDHVTVKCLPTSLPQSLEVSVDSLVTFSDSLRVADVVVPSDVIVQQDPDTVIATVQEPRKEEEVVPVVAEGEEGAEGAAEGEDGEKKEGDAAAEGGDAAAKDGAEKKDA